MFYFAYEQTNGNIVISIDFVKVGTDKFYLKQSNMYNLDRLLETILQAEECKDINVIAFMQDHVNRINGDQDLFSNSDFLKQTEKKLDRFRNLTSGCNRYRKNRTILTKELDILIIEFRHCIQNIEALITFLFGKHSKTYNQFFPDGITGMTSVTKEKLCDALLQFEKVMLKHEDQIGIALVKGYRKLKSKTVKKRTDQKNLCEKLESMTLLKNKLKKELLSLFQRNLYFCYIQNFNNTLAVKKLFNQSLLKSKTILAHQLVLSSNGNGRAKLENGQVHGNKYNPDYGTNQNN